MAARPTDPTGHRGARFFWRALTLLLLAAWLGQLAMFFLTSESRRSERLHEGRDIAIDIHSGGVTGTPYHTPAPPPPPKLVPVAPAPVPAAPATPPPAGATQPEMPAPVAPPTSTIAKPVPSVASASLPAVRAPLQPAPNPALTEIVGGSLVLPKIGADGLTAANFYKKPFTPAASQPRIALLVEDVGLHEAHTQAASALDEDVSLAWSPYATKLNMRIGEARRRGHEAWMEIPMQPENYPADDAGPNTLLTTDSAEVNLGRLRQTLASASGYVGVVAPQAEIFSANAMMGDLVEELRRRGLLLLMHASVTGSPKYDDMRLSVSRSIPATATPEQVRQALSELEAIARNTGSALGTLPAQPLAMKEVAAWLPTLKAKGIALAPVSALRPAAKP